MSVAAIVIGVVLGVLGLIILWNIMCSIYVVREREVVIVERFGKFHNILTAGVHWMFPFGVDKPKKYFMKYLADGGNGYSHFIEKNDYRISLQHEVLDFPKQIVITKDGAEIYLDAVLSFQLQSAASAKTVVYSVQNYPLVLSRLVQAHIRDVAATLDVDQLIEDTSAMNIIQHLLSNTVTKWGIKINFVKIQKVEANSLSGILEKKKQADLMNKEVIINAKSVKQTSLLASEGERDQLIKRAEGDAQKKISVANGEAKSIVNNARADAEAIKKIIPILQSRGEDPVRYMLSQKYMSKIGPSLKNADLQIIPQELGDFSSRKAFGILPMQSIKVD